jgi:hypothetical protein
VFGLANVSVKAGQAHLAAEYLSREFGHSVRNHGMKVSIRWWKDLVDAQGVTRKDKFWHVQ